MIEMRAEYRYVNGLAVLVKCLGMTKMTGIEVGTFAGRGAEIMLDTGLVSKLYCVDPWSPGYDPGDGASSESEMRAAELVFDRKFLGKDDRVSKVRCRFREAVEEGLLPNEPDFIYIDATHTYEGCHHDIVSAMSLRPKVICGHDYHRDWPGVIGAVTDSFGFPDAVFSDTSWVVFNPNERYHAK